MIHGVAAAGQDRRARRRHRKLRVVFTISGALPVRPIRSPPNEAMYLPICSGVSRSGSTLMSATLSPASFSSCRASCFCTLASSASVVGQTSGQCVKPKNTRVGWPRNSRGDVLRPAGVEQAEFRENARLRQHRARLERRDRGLADHAGDIHAGDGGGHGDGADGNPVAIRHGAIISHPGRPRSDSNRRRADRRAPNVACVVRACSSAMAPTTRAMRPRPWCST